VCDVRGPDGGNHIARSQASRGTCRAILKNVRGKLWGGFQPGRREFQFKPPEHTSGLRRWANIAGKKSRDQTAACGPKERGENPKAGRKTNCGLGKETEKKGARGGKRAKEKTKKADKATKPTIKASCEVTRRDGRPTSEGANSHLKGSERTQRALSDQNRGECEKGFFGTEGMEKKGGFEGLPISRSTDFKRERGVEVEMASQVGAGSLGLREGLQRGEAAKPTRREPPAAGRRDGVSKLEKVTGVRETLSGH